MATVDATAVRCTGCEAEVSVYEEGLCAFCRMEARGDGALLSHDSRGYLDHDGVTRVPCGCGCNGPVRVEDETLEQVRDILGHGQEVEIRLPREPVPWRREWIESLGGRIVIDPEAPMPLALQRDKEDGSMNGAEGLDALRAMDEGEPQQPERSAMSNGKRPRGYWTRERIIEAIQAWEREHGRPPTANEWTKMGDGHPNSAAVAKVFGKWSDGIAAAGFARPSRGTRYDSGRVAAPHGQWTREDVLLAIQKWAQEHDGVPPTSIEWGAASGPAPEGYPSQAVAKRLFGTWSKAIIAAGFEANGRGGQQPHLRVSVTNGWIKVPGSGLVYRSTMEGYAAADEMEHRAEQESESLRADGFDEAADVMLDKAREQADLIRRTMRVVEERGESQPEPAPLPVPAAPPEPVEEPAALPAVVPQEPPPLPAATVVRMVSDPEHVDVFELFESMATDERIAHYERVAEQAQLKAEALRSIRDALSTVRELEPA